MPEPDRWNLVYIHSHDTGRYVQPYGHAIATPHLQRFAEEGVLFRRAFCAAPTCSPSRAALLTGQSAHASGMLGLAHRGFRLADPGQHLLRTLQKAGYAAALAGLQHVFAAKDLPAAGYDFLPPGGRPAEVVARDFLARPPSQPFFLDVGFFETHRAGRGFTKEGEADAQETPDARFVRPPARLEDAPDTRQDMADYEVSARRLDRKIGDVLHALDANGLRDRTLVLITTDHGIAFPGMKCSLTDHGMGVMLMLRGPSGSPFAGGKTLDALVSQIDLFPTICDALGVERPAWLTGRSLLPLLRGETDVVNEEVFAEVTFHAAFEPKRAARTDRWKYIRNFGDRRRPVLPNCDDSLSKDLWLARGWAEQVVSREELYDLTFDPNETDNRAENPACAAILADLRGRLDRWMERTADPLLQERLPIPEGAVVNPADGVSPGEPPVPWTGASHAFQGETR